MAGPARSQDRKSGLRDGQREHCAKKADSRAEESAMRRKPHRQTALRTAPPRTTGRRQPPERQLPDKTCVYPWDFALTLGSDDL